MFFGANYYTLFVIQKICMNGHMNRNVKSVVTENTPFVSGNSCYWTHCYLRAMWRGNRYQTWNLSFRHDLIQLRYIRTREQRTHSTHTSSAAVNFPFRSAFILLIPQNPWLCMFNVSSASLSVFLYIQNYSCCSSFSVHNPALFPLFSCSLSLKLHCHSRRLIVFCSAAAAERGDFKLPLILMF